jgi:hypothetical protein
MKAFITAAFTLLFCSLVIAPATYALDPIDLPGGLFCQVGSNGKTSLYQIVNKKKVVLNTNSFLQKIVVQVAQLQKRLKNTPKSQAKIRKNLSSQIASFVKKQSGVASCLTGALGAYAIQDLLGTYSGTYSGPITLYGVSGTASGSFEVTLSLKNGTLKGNFIASDGLFSAILGGPGYTFTFSPGALLINKVRQFTSTSGSKVDIQIKSDGSFFITFKGQTVPGLGVVDLKFSVKPTSTLTTIEGKVQATLSSTKELVADISFSVSKSS